jgi:capsular polysaccharide biosynthesis protein
VTDVADDRSLATVVRDLRDAWRIIVLAVVACTLAGLLATLAQTDRYQAQGSVVVSPARFLDPGGTDALPALTDTVAELSSREAVLGPAGADYVTASRDEATRARRSQEATLTWLRLNTRAQRVGTSSVVELSATGSTARDAQDLARAFVSSLTRFVREARTGEAPSADGGPVGIGLVVLGAGELTGKISPTPLRNLFIGINAGLILGIVLALAMASRRRRQGAAQAAVELGVPCLGDVRPGAEVHGGGLFATHNLLEALSGPSGTLTVLLTGTSTSGRIADVAESLVRSLDRAGNRALLVDADGERRTLSRRLGAGERPGLLDAVAHGTDARRLVFTTPPAPQSDQAPVRLLPAGTPSSTELDRHRLRRLLERLGLQFNLVVISGPPLGDAADLGVLVSAADCWLLVADVNLTSRRLGEARALMERSGTPMMGTLGVDGAGRARRLPAIVE